MKDLFVMEWPMAIQPEVAHHWCKDLAENLTEFRRKPRMKPESKLAFISKQYASLFALVRINRGDAVMKGVPARMFEEATSVEEEQVEE